MPLNPWRSDFELVHGLRAESGRGRSLEISESSNFVCVAVFKNCCFCLPLQKQSNITSTAAHGPIRSTVAMQAGMEVSEQEESGSSRSYLHSNDPEDPNTPTNGGVEAASEHLGDQGEENQSFGFISREIPDTHTTGSSPKKEPKRRRAPIMTLLLRKGFLLVHTEVDPRTEAFRLRSCLGGALVWPTGGHCLGMVPADHQLCDAVRCGLHPLYPGP